MKTELIKLPEGNIIVNDDEPKSEDKVKYVGSVFILRNANLYDIENNNQACLPNQTAKLLPYRKLIASDNPAHNLPSIDYNGMEEQLGVVDVEKLADEYCKESDRLSNPNDYISYIEGFKKAQSLNDKKFSLEDIKKAIEFFKIYQLSTNRDVFDKDIHIYLQSLEHPKVIPIEVEMEGIYREPEINGNLTFTGKMQPKTTDNKIKITKVL